MRRLLLALLFPAAVGCVDLDAPANPSDTSVIELVVPPGATARGLTGELSERGLVRAAWRWRLFLRATDASCLKAGRFEVRRSMTMRQLVDVLCGPPLPEDEPFTVPEGWRIRDIDAALVDRGWIQPGAYATVALGKTVPAPFPVSGPTYEGYLFPETYLVVPEDFTPEDLVRRQLETFHQRFVVPHQGAPLGRELHDIVVMASIVEREEPAPANRALVAGVLWKRLDHGWHLGADATSRYTLDAWNDRRAFLKRLRDPDDAYNTRLRSGLPPTAIGNPGLTGLEAALRPRDSEFWYYLHDATGALHGARDKAGHEANRRRYDVY